MSGFRRASGAPPLVIGHRGVRGAAPENTMAAFSLAADSGADGVELDVRTCKSGELVVFHDATLDRCSQGRELRAVAEMTLSELRQVDVGNGERVPLLNEVLRWAREHRMRVNVEMKRDVPRRRDVVQQTARALVTSQAEDVIVSSFDPLMLGYFAVLCPAVAIGYLFASDQRRLLAEAGATLLRAGAMHPEHTCVDEASARAWKARDRGMNVWTVNDIQEAKRLSALGVDAIITDVPGLIGEAVR